MAVTLPSSPFQTDHTQPGSVDGIPPASSNNQKDKAVTLLWFFLAKQISLPKLDDPNAMRRWLYDPVNSKALAGVTQLGFGSYPLEVLPIELLQCPNLQWLNLTQTCISEVPEWISQLSELKSLLLNGNPMTGIAIKDLPYSITKLRFLERLELFDTLIQELPEWIGTLCELKTLTIRPQSECECMKGIRLPKSLGNLSKLETLTIGSSNFDDISAFIGNLSHLRELYICDTNLPKIPEEISSLGNLESLYIPDCGVTIFPEWIDKLSKLKTIDLSLNKITAIPPSLGSLSQLNDFNMRCNEIDSIPVSLGQLTALSWLKLEQTKISSFPKELCFLKTLYRLDLGSCPLQSLPDEIGNLESLTRLEISDTKVAYLPESITNLSKIQEVWAQKTQIKEVSPSIRNFFTGTRKLYL